MQIVAAGAFGYAGAMHGRMEDVVERIAEALRDEERRLCAEQAVYGLDALDEVGLHPLLAAGLAGAGIFREWPYPWEGQADDPLPKASERERCDIVLTPSGELPPADRVAEAREIASVSGTLFESIAAAEPGPPSASPDETLWLEVKAVGQYTLREGVAQANRAYASELVGGPAEDLFKLAQEPGIEFGAAVLLLFAQSEEVAEHDVTEATHRILDRGAPTGSPVRRMVPIADRIGNSVVSVSLFPLRR